MIECVFSTEIDISSIIAYPAFYARSHGREFNIESVQARQVADFA